MISSQSRFDSGQPVPAMADRVSPNFTFLHAVTMGFIVLLALAAYVTLDQTIRVQQASVGAIALTDRQRMLSQRIANLAAQYTLGNGAVRSDLSATISDLASSRPAGSDAIGDYIARARSITALSPQHPALLVRPARLLLAALQPLLNAFNAELQVRAERANEQLALLRVLGVAICALIPATLLFAFITVLRPMAQRIAQLARDARELSEHTTTDPLTGMLNKRSFQSRAAIEINKARRYGRPLSLLMIDADQLSAIEDTHGRDTVLRALTSSFFGATRISDLVARFEADQFAILLPETSCEGAQLLAERLRHKISDLAVEINRMPVNCTISVGVAAAEKDASFLWPTFKRADEALYEAKMRGRNRVVVAAAA